MNRISITFKISISLACLLVSILLAAHTVGFFPNPEELQVQSQLMLCETIAVQTSLAIQSEDRDLMEECLHAIVQRNPDIAYARVVRNDETISNFTDNGIPTGTDNKNQLRVVTVPIASNDQPWGSVELGLRRQTVAATRLGRLNPLLQLTLFCGCLAVPAYFVYLQRVLQHLDPSEVVPDRVRKTLDTLAEGLVVVDRQQRIVLANNALAVMLDSTPDELLSQNITKYPWLFEDEELFDEELPWYLAMTQKQIVAGQVLHLTNEAGQKRTLRVNASPIEGAKDECEGALVSFDDVTLLEERNTALTSMLDKLRDSRNQIQRQNHELTILATRDSLTGALNRRCFFEEFDKHWAVAQENKTPISCIMIDIDHFKSINDNFGHAIGDEVLIEVVKLIEETIHSGDILSRYGGEEFCVLCPGTSVNDAIRMCNAIRDAIETKHMETVGSVTASLGVSANEYGAESPNEMLNEADSGLYHSKRTGRNRVTGWGDIRNNGISAVEQNQEDDRISSEAVNALLLALGNRDTKTVEHCQRVAKLCYAASSKLFSQTERHLLKNAALLHDIGKISVPDSVLLKEGPLTSEEKQIIKSHSFIGVDIVRATLGRDDLADLIQFHLSDETRIPAPARLLSIVDAYDSMINDQSYRQGLSKTEVIATLKRLAGKKFDPSLVKHFIGFVTEQSKGEWDSTEPRTERPLEKQLHQLSDALDDRDHKLAAQLTREIVIAAHEFDVPAITELVETLAESTKHDDQWITSVRTTVQLLDLCRMTREQSGSKAVSAPRTPLQHA